ncbi:MAG: hypothetical protein HY791_14115 [Deltaproteobacteria bacterium]|nr:hypothetical protein [Deltaproteobacteria bacterium]
MSATFLAERAFPYCKGCGHGLVARRLNEALVRLEVSPSDVVLTSDIGCVGLVDPHFPTAHSVHTIHGRSTAIAAGAVLADGVLAEGKIKNVVMIGDGGATIGLQHLSQAALMNVDLTVLLHNNMLYGMTGGQHSALTPQGFRTTTTPEGNWVPAIDMAEFIRSNKGGYFARKLATDADLAAVICEAISHPGFAMVEVLELCTGFAVPLNHLDGKSLKAMADSRGQALGVLIRDRSREPYHEVYRKRFPGLLSTEGTKAESGRVFAHRLDRALTVVVAGSAGERVQSSAALLGQAAVLSGLHVVQKNDYPVTVGSGFSLAEVKISPEPILFTGTEAPNAVLIVSTDGLKEVRSRGDLSRLPQDGVVMVDSSLPDVFPRVWRLAVRKTFGGEGAALGAVSAWVHRTGYLDPESLVAAAELAGPSLEASTRRVISMSTPQELQPVLTGHPT